MDSVGADVGTIGVDCRNYLGRMFRMAKGSKQAQTNAKKDARKTGYRLWETIHPLASLLADKTGDDMTTIVNHAVRAELQRQGMWPGASLMDRLLVVAKQVEREPEELLADAINNFLNSTEGK